MLDSNSFLSRTAIIDMAENYFEKMEYRKISLDDLAEVSGLRRESLKKIFSSIREIQVASVRRHLTLLIFDLQAFQLTNSPLTDLKRLFTHISNTFVKLKNCSPVQFALIKAALIDQDGCSNYISFVQDEVHSLLQAAYLSGHIHFSVRGDDQKCVALALYTLLDPVYLSDLTSDAQREKMIDMAIFSLIC